MPLGKPSKYEEEVKTPNHQELREEVQTRDLILGASAHRGHLKPTQAHVTSAYRKRKVKVQNQDLRRVLTFRARGRGTSHGGQRRRGQRLGENRKSVEARKPNF